MAKKSFKSLPKSAPPTVEQINAFVNSGPGTDHRPKATAEQDNPIHNGEPLRRLSVDIPESLHTRFKVACAKARAKMGPEIIAFIERRIRELEQRT